MKFCYIVGLLLSSIFSGAEARRLSGSDISKAEQERRDLELQQITMEFERIAMRLIQEKRRHQRQRKIILPLLF